jgi:hypothetical protein
LSSHNGVVSARIALALNIRRRTNCFVRCPGWVFELNGCVETGD